MLIRGTVTIFLFTALTAEAESAKSLLNRANARSNRGEFQEALSIYSRVIQMPSLSLEDMARAYLKSGSCRMYLRKYDEAINDFQSLIKQLPKDQTNCARAIDGIGNCYMRTGNYKSAIKTLSKGLKRYGDVPGTSISIVYRLAQAYYSSRDYESAVPLFKQMAEDKSKFLSVRSGLYSYLSRSLERLRRFDEAIEVYYEFQEKYPEERYYCGNFQSKIANCYAQMKRYVESAEAYLEIKEKYPEQLGQIQQGAYWAGRNYRMAGDYQRTIQIFESYLKNYKSIRGAAKNALGEILSAYQALEDKEKVLETYERMVKELRDNPVDASDALYQMANFLLQDSRLEEVDRTVQKMFLEFPSNRALCLRGLDLLLQVYQKMGQKSEALAASYLKFIMTSGANSDDTVGALNGVLEMLRLKDGTDRRVNLFVLYQRFGPRGSDGKAGTDDDLRNPMAGEWLKLEANIRQGLQERIDRWAVSNERLADSAYAHLYLGNKKKALRSFQRGFALAPATNQQMANAIADLEIGLKAATGNLPSAERLHKFLNHGPDGPDGKSNTDDDLTDPVAEVLNSLPDTVKMEGDREVRDGEVN